MTNTDHKTVSARPSCVICVCGTTTIQFISMQTHCWYNFMCLKVSSEKKIAPFIL